MNRTVSGNDLLIQPELVAGVYSRTSISLAAGSQVVARTFRDGQWSGPISLTPSVPGDANDDGIFDSLDLAFVFAIGEYQDDIARNSSFADGDWDGDGEFTSEDIVWAFRHGGYRSAPAVSSAFQSSRLSLSIENRMMEFRQGPVVGIRDDGTSDDRQSAKRLDLLTTDSIFGERWQ